MECLIVQKKAGRTRMKGFDSWESGIAELRSIGESYTVEHEEAHKKFLSELETYTQKVICIQGVYGESAVLYKMEESWVEQVELVNREFTW